MQTPAVQRLLCMTGLRSNNITDSDGLPSIELGHRPGLHGWSMGVFVLRCGMYLPPLLG